jgi:hypothetical protein
MLPDKRKSLATPGGGDEATANESGNDSGSILPFPTSKRTCACCGIQFQPLKTWHRLCRTCFAYSKAGSHIQLAARLLKGGR